MAWRQARWRWWETGSTPISPWRSRRACFQCSSSAAKRSRRRPPRWIARRTWSCRMSANWAREWSAPGSADAREAPLSIVAGVDFGTQSVRFSIFDSERGRLGSGVAAYPLLKRADDPDYAAQRHADHLQALVSAAHQAVAVADIDGRRIEALGIDTTGSTIVPVGENLQPLDDYYLWC